MFPIPDEQVARHIGLAQLRVGAGRADTAQGVGPRVLAWWAASVRPTFTRPWTVGAVHEELWTGGPNSDWVAIRGSVADTDGAAVAPLEADPALDALGALNPFRVEPTHRRKAANADVWCEAATLDGLGYTLRWGTRAVRSGELSFSNPRAAWLVELERVLFGFARQVVAASGASRFESQLECWAEYREPLKHAEPDAAPDRRGM